MKPTLDALQCYCKPVQCTIVQPPTVCTNKEQYLFKDKLSVGKLDTYYYGQVDRTIPMQCSTNDGYFNVGFGTGKWQVPQTMNPVGKPGTCVYNLGAATHACEKPACPDPRLVLGAAYLKSTYATLDSFYVHKVNATTSVVQKDMEWVVKSAIKDRYAGNLFTTPLVTVAETAVPAFGAGIANGLLKQRCPVKTVIGTKARFHCCKNHSAFTYGSSKAGPAKTKLSYFDCSCEDGAWVCTSFCQCNDFTCK